MTDLTAAVRGKMLSIARACARLVGVAALLAMVMAARPATAPSEKKYLELEFGSLIGNIGRKSAKTLDIVSGPNDCKMNRDQVHGQEWIVSFEKLKFKVSIEDGVKIDVKVVIKELQRIPSSYFRAFEVVSQKGKNGVAVYPDLEGASAHGGQEYINIVPQADAPVLAHEIGHTLEQVASGKDPETLDKWEAAIIPDNISVSAYGDTVRHEDLAEFSCIYAVCLDAGPDNLATLQKLSPRRFALWEKILKGESTL